MSASSIRPGAGGEAPPTAETLFETLYGELHRLARSQLRRGGASLSATTLLHEAYLSMRERDAASFPDRARFIGYASRAMRGLVVDYARQRHAQKRGGDIHLTALDTDIVDASAAEGEELLHIGDALDALAQTEPGLAEVVDLKFFCGLSIVEIAALRGVSARTIEREWLKARIYLRRALADESTST